MDLDNRCTTSPPAPPARKPEPVERLRTRRLKLPALRSFALAVALACTSNAGGAQAAQQAPKEERPEAHEIAAFAPSMFLTWSELDPVLVERYAMTKEGRAALEHLLTLELLEHMAGERRMTISAEDVERRWQELDRELLAAGESGGLRQQLRDNQVDPAHFRELLRVLIMQELFAREALGLPPDAKLSPDQQEIWMQQVMQERGLDTPAPPWKDGIVGRCGPVVVREDAYRVGLRQMLGFEKIRETCYQLLLMKGLRKRMPDLSSKALDAQVAIEMDRRRQEALVNPRYRGMSFEALLKAQGSSPERLARDPSVQVASLVTLWVDRRYSEQDLQQVYRDERERFDANFGEALRCRVLFLTAAQFTNPLNPRSFEEAEQMLSKLAKQLTTEEAFASAARLQSEDSNTRSGGGEVGWVTRGAGLPAGLTSALFDDLERRGPLPAGGRSLGPLRTNSGCALLWISEHREAPGWDSMRRHVHNELRRRTLEEIAPRNSVITYLDS